MKYEVGGKIPQSVIDCIGREPHYGASVDGDDIVVVMPDGRGFSISSPVDDCSKLHEFCKIRAIPEEVLKIKYLSDAHKDALLAIMKKMKDEGVN